MDGEPIGKALQEGQPSQRDTKGDLNSTDTNTICIENGTGSNTKKQPNWQKGWIPVVK